MGSSKGFKEIRFDRLNSIYYLTNLITDVINRFKRGGVECDIKDVSRAFGEYWAGRCFRLKRKGSSHVVYPFFGIGYKDELPVIYFSFDKNWCGRVYAKLNGKNKTKSFYNINSMDDEVRFELKQGKFAEFAGASLKQQRAILEEFFNRMLDDIAPYL